MIFITIHVLKQDISMGLQNHFKLPIVSLKNPNVSLRDRNFVQLEQPALIRPVDVIIKTDMPWSVANVVLPLHMKTVLVSERIALMKIKNWIQVYSLFDNILVLAMKWVEKNVDIQQQSISTTAWSNFKYIIVVRFIISSTFPGEIYYFRHVRPSVTKVCTCNSYYILNGNSSKMWMLDYYQIKIRISLQNCDQNVIEGWMGSGVNATFNNSSVI